MVSLIWRFCFVNYTLVCVVFLITPQNYDVLKENLVQSYKKMSGSCESDIFCALVSVAILFSGGSFFGESLFSSGFCFCLSLGGSKLSFFLGHGLCLSLVLGLFCLEASLYLFFFLVGHNDLEFVDLCLTGFFPSCETTLCLSFVESTFLNTTLKVLHQEYALV